MPGPLDYLKQAGQFLTTPVVSKQAIQPMQEALDAPSLERSPMEAQLRGFGAGALEGLRGLTTPLNIGSAVMGGSLASGMGRLAGAAGEAMPALGQAAAEFAPVGGEAAYNAGRTVQAAADPMESVYQQVLANRGGLASEAGKISPEMAALTGGAMAGLGYAGKKLYDTLSAKKDELSHKLNPYQKYSDLTAPYGQK